VAVGKGALERIGRGVAEGGIEQVEGGTPPEEAWKRGAQTQGIAVTAGRQEGTHKCVRRFLQHGFGDVSPLEEPPLHEHQLAHVVK
jgi:hypothetical protein